MSEEILKLAQECGWPEEAGEPECGSLNLEAFYRAAFNAGLNEAIRVGYDTVQYGSTFELADQMRLDIQALELK